MVSQVQHMVSQIQREAFLSDSSVSKEFPQENATLCNNCIS